MPTVTSGHTLNIGYFTTSSGVTVLSGGTLNVDAGGTVIDTVDSGGIVWVYGSRFGIGRSIHTMVTSGGHEGVLSRGIASGTYVGNYGQQEILLRRCSKRHDRPGSECPGSRLRRRQDLLHRCQPRYPGGAERRYCQRQHC